jgi:hypothetical protein
VISMKTPASSAWVPGLILVIVWSPGSFGQNETNRPATDAAPLAMPAQVFPPIPAPMDFPQLPSVESDVLVSKRQAPEIRLSPWTREIVKLAESGIEDSVILSYIENSGTFNLGADQIVYLNDLGLSSEIITSMLRHDQEIVSGARPLTIVSEPDWGRAFDALTTTRQASHKVLPLSATNPGFSSPTTTETAPTPGQENLPEGNRAFTQLATVQHARPDELATSAFSQPLRSPAKKAGLYRVREPYPEEITAPIILIHGESRIPNTVVVVGFPRTTP